MDLYDIAVARKLSGGSGGGGSSDFTTANVTLVKNVSQGVIQIPTLYTFGADDIALSSAFSQSGDYSIILHSGKCGISVDASSYTISGSASDLGNGTVLATGDCTITIGE